MAELERGENGSASASLRIVEYHSPIEDLLRRYPILARLEREMFERVLDSPVRREEECSPGMYRCTFHLGSPTADALRG